MPLRPEHRRYYGKTWQRFRLELIAQAGGEYCSHCKRFYKGINGAHTDHDPKNRKGVVLMCPRCHATHDAGHRIAIMRRNRADESGQGWLLPELEWAPYASWEIPGWIYDRIVQLRLF